MSPIPSDLPPGVSPHMIPGNRPEDAAEEEWWNKFDEKVENIAIPSEAYDSSWFNQAILAAKEMGYNEGYSDGRTEERQSSD